MRLATPRYLLRDFCDADRQAFIAYQMDPRYRRLYDFHDDHGERVAALFETFRNWATQRPRSNVQLGIFQRSDSRLLGCAGLRREEQPDNSAVFGLELTPEAWGRFGTAIEVASSLIEYGFATLELDTIIGASANGNDRVERLAHWFGAAIIDHRDGPGWMTSRGWHEVVWSLPRDAWAASRARQRLLAAV